MGRCYIYAGSWLDETGMSGGGIRLFKQDSLEGMMELVDVYREDIAAGYICISADKKFLYTVNEIKRKPECVQSDGSIYAFLINQTDGTLTEINHVSSCGVFPNYLKISSDNKMLFGINYGSEDMVVRSKCNDNGDFTLETIYEESNMFSVMLNPDGSLGKICDIKQLSGEPSRFYEWFQASPHAHCIGLDPSERMLIVADRGCDEILSCKVNKNNGKFGDLQKLNTNHGVGPRNCVYHPFLPYVYVVGEIQPYILMFEYDVETTKLKLAHEYLTVKKEFVYTGEHSFFDYAHPSDIQIHPNGKYLYVANRGPDTITCFQIHEINGTLEFIEEIDTGGKWPWSFTMDSSGQYMYIANKASNSISIFKMDSKGSLSFLNECTDIERTVCLKFLEII